MQSSSAESTMSIVHSPRPFSSARMIRQLSSHYAILAIGFFRCCRSSTVSCMYAVEAGDVAFALGRNRRRTIPHARRTVGGWLLRLALGTLMQQSAPLPHVFTLSDEQWSRYEYLSAVLCSLLPSKERSTHAGKGVCPCPRSPARQHFPLVRGQPLKAVSNTYGQKQDRAGKRRRRTTRPQGTNAASHHTPRRSAPATWTHDALSA